MVLLALSAAPHAVHAAPAGRAEGALAAGEPALGEAGPEGDYLRAVHARLHKVWHDQYLRTVSALDRVTAGEDADRQHAVGSTAGGHDDVTLSVEIRWDGSVAGINVERSSGDFAFDQAAMALVKTAAPLPVAAHNLLSDDGYLHLTWTLARDERACAAGARFFRADDPLDVALPRLLAAHRFDESVRRVSAAPADEREAATDRLARLWLAMPVPSVQADVRAASALAHLGDHRQEGRLRAGLAIPQTAVAAADALQGLGADVCGAVGPLLHGSNAVSAQAGLSILDLRASKEPEAVPCASLVSQTVGDPAVNAAVRARLVPWVARDRGAWKGRFAALIVDKSASVRAAALLVSVKRGGGRPEMYRIVEFLHDPSAEVRGAASAGLVRAAGDQALDQLYLLSKEKDARPYELVSAELATFATPATAEFLGKLLKHGGVSELPAARALAARKDPAARALIEPVLAAAAQNPEARPELRALALPPGHADGASLDPQEQQYRALLLGHHSREAATWLLAHLSTNEPVQAVPLLCDWLERGRVAAASELSPGAGPHSPTSPSSTGEPLATTMAPR